MSWSYFVCQFPDSGYFSAAWLPKQVKQISAIEQGKLLLAELERDFFEVEGKGYRSMIGKNWEKRRKAGVEILTYLTPSIKRDLSQLQGCLRRLKLQPKKDDDLREKWTSEA